ncbi:MAG: heavy metal translocating P-type ATPase [Bacteriovorax sp.]
MNKIFKIEGMTCASCSQIIEDHIKKMTGVESVQVNFATEKADLSYSDKFDFSAFHEALGRLGYRAFDLNDQKIEDRHSFFNSTLMFSLASLLAGGISMGLSMGPFSHFFELSTNNVIQLVLSSLVLVIFGRIYLASVLQFLRSGHSNMNTLIGLGVLAAYFYSLVLMFMANHAHVYFETIPFLVGFTLFGHFLEDKAKTKARNSLSSLYKMQIKFAAKMEEGVEKNTPVVELKIGDIIRLRPGDKIPLDGVVSEGTTHTDESMLSGESKAVAKNAGDKVFAGSLNLEGSVLVRVEKELHQTFVSDVVKYVEKAQLRKAPIQKYADKVVRYFVPGIIVISLVTFALWWTLNTENKSYEAFSHMIAVLLIACPCALGLAVPMGVMLSTAEASRKGLLISGGDIIEKASSIDVVVFDKTGTLTEGHPEVTEVLSKIDEGEFFRIVGSVVQYSNHPLSKAISKFIDSKKINISDPDKFKNIPGFGTESLFEGRRILMGKAELLTRENIRVEESSMTGSLVYVGIDQQYAGVFVIEDPLKPESKSTINSLIEEGLEVWMLTGDNFNVAQKIALELGIKNFKGNVLPVEKANFVYELQQSGKKVAMVGDGINDAPALSSANLGVAMSSGSDVAVEASEVSILEGKIQSVAYFFRLSKRTMRVIKENLFLSFFYNLLCIPLAAGALYPLYKISLTPMWASLAMGLSSVSVVLSSLRLKRPL